MCVCVCVFLIHNDELYNRYRSPNTVRVIKSIRLGMAYSQNGGRQEGFQKIIYIIVFLIHNDQLYNRYRSPYISQDD